MRKRIVVSLLVIGLMASIFAGCGQAEVAEQASAAGMAVVAAPGYEASAQKLVDAIEGAGMSAQIEEEIPENSTYRPVLIGPVEVEAAKAEMLKLREKDYVIAFEKDYILIAGGSAEAAGEAVAAFTEEYMEYFQTYGDFPFGEEYSKTSIGSYGGATTKRILLGNVSAHRYVLATKNGEQTEAAVLLQTVLKNAAAMELPIVDADSLTDSDYAIVFGSTADEKAQGYVSQLEQKEGWIRQEGNRLYLCADVPEKELLVTKLFISKYLSYDYTLNASTLQQIELGELNLAFSYDRATMTAPEVTQAKVLDIPAVDSFATLQGGCTDGKYAYYIVNKQIVYPYTNIIYKVDLDTFEVVQVSDELEMEHANSITYNSKTGELIVVHYDPTPTALSVVDPETLTVKRVEHADFHVLSLAYHAEKDMYVAGVKGAFDFMLLDSKFNVVGERGSVQSRTTKQEVECDGDRIWFFMSEPNVIFCYDWDDNYQFGLEVGGYLEAENIIFRGDLAYLGYLSSGGVFYESIFYQELAK